ncbi:MAG TPA: VLRF1 family aeRF1-type release factor, partial [Miltoncostaeaceae bacterium]|nr:VLRF1 family aeRF1-type release factor [Miltoncostaeaceae bacterium]
MTRTGEILEPLTSLTDPLGVLSVYLDARPSRIAAQRPEWEVELRKGLGRLRDRVKEEGDHAHWTAVHTAMDALEDDLTALVDQESPGRGRVLFAALSTGEVRTLRLQVELPDAVVLEERPYLTPLVAALDEAQPVGILNVSRDGVRVVDRAFGEAEDVEFFEFDADTSEWRRKRGTSGHNPALGTPGTGGMGGGGPATGPMYQQSGTDHRDRYNRKLEDHQVRFVKDVAPQVADMAREREWGYVVLVGDPRLTRPLEEGFPPNPPFAVLPVEGTVEWQPAHELAEHVLPHVTEARRAEEARLVQEARGHAAAGGPGSTDIGAICEALFQGRVATLLLSHGRDWEGVRAPDGRLAPAGHAPDGVAPGDLQPEPRLGERMLEMALDTSARALVVEDDLTALVDQES